MLIFRHKLNLINTFLVTIDKNIKKYVDDIVKPIMFGHIDHNCKVDELL